jgi:hypothetical protein
MRAHCAGWSARLTAPPNFSQKTKPRKQNTMCQFKSAIVLRDAKNKGGFQLLLSPWTESHSDLITIHKLRDDGKLRFARVEFSPPTMETAHLLDGYILKIDEERTPDWFDDEMKVTVADKLRDYVKRMIVTGDVALLIGGQFIIAPNAKVECAKAMIINAVLSGGTVQAVESGGTVQAVLSGGTVQAVWSGGTVQRVESGGTVQAVLSGGTVQAVWSGGTVQRVESGGTVKNVESGGTVQAVESGGTVQNVWSGGTVQRMESGGTVQRVESGGTVQAVLSGGTVQRVWSGGTVQRVESGGTVQAVLSGGTVQRVWSGGTVQRNDNKTK